MPDNYKLPFDSADYLFAPIELPSPDTDLEVFLRQCNEKINKLVCEAWKRGALPDRTVLVQCLTKSLVEGQVDFRHPVILKRQKTVGEDRLQLLGCFAHTTFHLKNRQKSSHSRMRDLGDTSRGATVIFTKKEPLSAWQANTSHILHFGFPPTNWGTPMSFHEYAKHFQETDTSYSVDMLGDYSVDYEAFDINAFVDLAADRQLDAIVRDKASPGTWDGSYTPAGEAHFPKRIEQLYQDIKSDKQYQDRVAVLLEYGTIVLSAPQAFTFARPPSSATREDTSVIFDSGLTLVFSGDEPPTLLDLHQIQAVAHNISVFIASTYGLANQSAQESQTIAARNIVSMIGHSLRNTFSKASREGEQLERLIQLESIKLAAASVLFDPSIAHKKALYWDTGGYSNESLEETVKRGLFGNGKAIDLSLSALVGKRIASRFAALLVELCQNLHKHSKSGKVEVLSMSDEPHVLEVIVSGCASESHLTGLLNRLEANNVLERGQALRGWHFLLMLTHALAQPESLCMEVSFDDQAGNTLARMKGRRGAKRILLSIEQTPNSPSSNRQLAMRIHIHHLMAVMPLQ